MANPWVKRIVGIVAGVIAAGVVVALVEGLGHMVFPPPPGLDVTKPEDQARLMEVIPLAAKIAVVAAWFLGALAGAWVVLRLSGYRPAAWVVAGVMVALSLITTQMFPHPLWMVVAAIALPLLAAWLALRSR